MNVATSFRETNGTRLSGIVVEPSSGNVFVGDINTTNAAVVIPTRHLLSSQNDTITTSNLPPYPLNNFRIYSLTVMAGGVTVSLSNTSKTNILSFFNFVNPKGVAVSSLHEAYFTDGSSVVRKVVIDPVSFTISPVITISNRFTSAYGIAIDPRVGYIYVSENITGSSIKILLQDGGYFDIPGTNISGKTPTHIATYGKFLYVIDQESTAIRNISLSRALNDVSCIFPIDPTIVFYVSCRMFFHFLYMWI